MRTPYSPPCDRWQMLRVGLAISLTSSVVLLAGTIAVRLYTVTRVYEQQRIDQKHQEMLQRLEYLKTEKNYETCVAEAQRIPTDSLFYSQAQTLRDQCQNALTAASLTQAQALAAAGQLKDALAKAQSITDGAAAAQVQQLTWQWSEQILQIAEGYYLDPSGKLEAAIQTASSLTPENSLYNEAQSRIRTWQQEWSANEVHWQAAQVAVSTYQLDAALAEIRQITHPYWRQQAGTLVKAVYAERATLQPAQEIDAEKDHQTQSFTAELLVMTSGGMVLLFGSWVGSVKA